MRLKNITLLIYALLLCVTVSAQKVDITDPIIKKVGDDVVISFDTKVDKVSTNSMLTITPELSNSDKKKSLLPMVVMGRVKVITQARKGVEVKTGNIISNSTLSHHYETTIPFEKWMTGATLSIGKMVETCNGLKDRLSSVVIASNILETAPLSEPVIVTPLLIPIFGSDVKAAYVNEFQQTLDASVSVYFVGSKESLDNNNKGLGLIFRQESSVVDESYMNNNKSIHKIRETIKLIKADSNIYITKLIIEGGSSPEGNYIYNEKLAQDRAEALIDYFSPNVASDILEVENIGENWVGLDRMIKSSNMKYRDEILSIINNYSINEGRERKLMDLDGGSSYRYMLKEFFPELRKASYVEVLYNIHPNDEFVKIDKASELITLKNYRESLDLLQKVTPTPYTDNLTGVCYMMMGDSANAHIYLQKAIEGGNSDAQKNLNKMNNQIKN